MKTESAPVLKHTTDRKPVDKWRAADLLGQFLHSRRAVQPAVISILRFQISKARPTRSEAGPRSSRNALRRL